MGKYSPYAIAQNKTPEWKPGEEVAAAAFIGIAIFVVADVNVAIWRVFRKAQGLYYWSMKLGTLACLLDAIGVILKYLTPNPYHIWGFYTACLLIGWSIYAPAQLLVLYSRLHLVNDSRKIQKWVYIMILSTVFLIVIPTWVVVWPAYNPNSRISSVWSPRDAIVERYNQIGFTVVEMVLSGIYIWSLLGLLNLKSSVRQRRVMLDLIYVNLIITALDIIVVVLVYLNQTGLSHPIQTCSYAVKLKLEFIVLNQLMSIAARGIKRTEFEDRRYHRTSAVGAFSAECQEWDRKTPGQVTGARPGSHDSPHSNSIQITLPSPIMPKQHSNVRYSNVSEDPRNSQRISSQIHGWRNDEKRIGQDGTGQESHHPTETFLDTDDNDSEAIRHKPSEAFSGSTLRSSAPREESSHPLDPPRRYGNTHASNMSPNHMSSNQSQHYRQNENPHVIPKDQRKIPHIARIRRQIPKNARYVHDDEDEEEEIGVHMWENRKGSLVMEVPWFQPRVDG